MKRKFDALRENLEEFVEQEQYSAMVVSCAAEELAYVVKFLQALGETHPADFFVVFAQPFKRAAEYLDVVVDNVRVQVEAANPMRESRGEQPFPALPQVLFDASVEAHERLRTLLQYLVSLLPNPKEHRMIVGLLPNACADLSDYITLITPSLPLAGAEPWMEPLRLLVYDERVNGVLVPTLKTQATEHILTLELDFSTPALADALAKDAGDPKIPARERMASLMQLAAIDYSYQRYDDALLKYAALYDFYERENLPLMQALCLLGAGDTLRAAGQQEPAKIKLQQTIALCMAHQVKAVLQNALISITELCMELEQPEEAESYANSGIQLAANLLNPFTYADFHEKRGDAELAQNKRDAALVSYQKCEEICNTYEHTPRLLSVLEKQILLYKTISQAEAQHAAEERLVMARKRAPDSSKPHTHESEWGAISHQGGA